ncbi:MULTISPECIES: MoaD/ThiS family protein [Nocardiopsis]|uniref:Molybdopterin converting factor small subunit n=1 Tax=Nocardiopsis sinuspersici TaxID=501010 RepID=A0A1V3C6X1_9ACTN|nr:MULTISPECIES: MoaD/ThiS family protein [Nocardiopsis]NYH53149.1 molybdopterin converting factor small subunit [Nocardiopsis sinuspersici]OOC56517.1 molybdopterin synthase sulfur carrier subunit [Nocardiopsis sinuspersici]
MRVTVHLPGLLRADADGSAHVPLEVDDGTALDGVLDALTARYPGLDRRIRDERGRLRRYVNVFVDEDECRTVGGLAAPLHDGADVRVLPSVAGG